MDAISAGLLQRDAAHPGIDRLPRRAETTTYSYTFYPDNGPTGSAIETETTSLPAVSTADGGTGSAPTSSDVYNSLGQLVWSQDANGSISYTGYDPATGAVTEQIQDVNFGPTYNVGNTQFDNDLGLLPQSWGLPTTGKNLVTTYHVDSQGRTIEETDPDGDVTCTVYNDAVQTVTDSSGTAMVLDEVRTYPGWNYDDTTGEWQTTGAVQVSCEVASSNGDYSQSLTCSWPSLAVTTVVFNGTTYYVPAGTEGLSDAAIDSLSRSLVNPQGQVTEEDDYANLSGVAYSATTPQLVGASYDSTFDGYDSVGNLVRTEDGDGNITRTVYDFLGQTTSTWVGTDDTPTPGSGNWSPTNPVSMVETSATVYDNGGVGDGDVTETIDFPYAPTSPLYSVQSFRVTQMCYDWQDRQVATKSGALVAAGSGGFQVDGVGGLFLNPGGESTAAGEPSARSRMTCSTTLAKSPPPMFFPGAASR